MWLLLSSPGLGWEMQCVTHSSTPFPPQTFALHHILYKEKSNFLHFDLLAIDANVLYMWWAVTVESAKNEKEKKMASIFFFFLLHQQILFILKLCVVGDGWRWWWNRINYVLIPLPGFCCFMSYRLVWVRCMILSLFYGSMDKLYCILYCNCICARYAPP